MESLTFPTAYQTVHHELEHSNANALITGRAGSGKSTLLRHWLGLTAKTVAVVAPSAVAAMNIGGMTIHAFCQMRPNTLPGAVKTLDGPQRDLYRRLDAIVIDEISMCRADVLDCLEQFMRRNGPRPDMPFGGVQLVMVGDLGQLPPVVAADARPIFCGGLYASPHFTAAGMTNARVRAINADRLSWLPGCEYVYEGHVEGDWTQLPTERELCLKPGARVMMLNNDPEKRWVNGSTRYVVRTGLTPRVELDTGATHDVEPYTWEQSTYVFDPQEGIVGTEVIGTYEQIPIRLAWAMTSHKVQSLSLDDITIDRERGPFAPGQAYV